MKRREFFTAIGAALLGTAAPMPKEPVITWKTSRPIFNKVLVDVDALEKLAAEAGRRVVITRGRSIYRVRGETT